MISLVKMINRPASLPCVFLDDSSKRQVPVHRFCGGL